MGNSLTQYRATIGLFNGCRMSSVCRSGLRALLVLAFILFILLLLQYAASPYISPSTVTISPFVIVADILILLSSQFSIGKELCSYLLISKIHKYHAHHDIDIKLQIALMTLILTSLEFVYFYIQRLLLSGDIELNPGPNDLNICHINCRGLSSAKMLALKHDIQHKFHLITLSETFLSQNSNQDLHLDGYHEIQRRDRDTFGGGVAVYVSNNLAYKRREDLEVNNFECLWLEIRQKSNKFLLATIYRPPNANHDFWDDFQTIFDNVISQNFIPIIITGDLNSDPLTRNGACLREFADSNYLTIHVDQPTRVTEHSASILDQFLTNIPNLVKDISIHPPLSTNDHCTIAMVLSFKVHNCADYQRHVWSYKNADFRSLKDAILNYDWEPCFDSQDIDIVLQRWTTSFLNLARQHIPNRLVTIRARDAPWFNAELRKLRQNKNKSHNLAKLHKTPSKWNDFRQARNLYVGKLREAEALYKEKLSQKLKDPSNINSKYWWHLTNKFLNKCKTSDIPPINDPISDEIHVSETDKANVFNKAFAAFSELNSENANIPNEINKKTNSTFNSIAVTINEVEDILRTLNPSKASGPDQVSCKMLKETAHSIAPVLTRLITLSLHSKRVPQGWKEANVIPVHKKGNKSNCNNYRPISLLNITGKVCERVVFKHLFNYINSNNLITSHQSGFMPGDSTVNQLAYMYNIFAKALNDKKDIRLVFCDQSKAFDKVWHKGLLYKLRTLGIEGSLHDWLTDYLHERRQRVAIRNGVSSWVEVKAGVPSRVHLRTTLVSSAH